MLLARAVLVRAVLVRAVRVLAALVLAVVALGWSWGGAPALAAEDPWQWPLSGPHAVARPFEAPGHRYAAGHRGADLPGLPGEAVRAAGAGRVSYAGLVAGRGVVVVVHGALRTTYEPVTATVRVGSAVGAGDVLGLLDAGHRGCWAPACLHWGLKRGEDYLDPVRLVERGPVRLLPLEGGVRPALRSAVGPDLRPRAAVEAAAPVRATGRDGDVAAGTSPAPPVVAEDGRVPAPAPEQTAAMSRGAAAGLASTAAASLLGAAAAGAAARRRG